EPPDAPPDAQARRGGSGGADAARRPGSMRERQGGDPGLRRRVEAVRRHHHQLHLREHRPDVGDRGEPQAVHRPDRHRRADLPARADGARAEGGAGLRVRHRGLRRRLRGPLPGARALQLGARRAQPVQRRPEPPEGPGPRRLHPDPARRRRALRRPREDLRAALRRPDAHLDVPQGHLREAPGPDGGRPGVRPDPERAVDLAAVLRALRLDPQERPRRRALRVRPPGQAARLADERLLQRALGVRRRLLPERDGGRPLRLRRPGRAAAGPSRVHRGRRDVPQARVDRPPGEPGLGLDRAGRGVHGRRVRHGRHLARERRRRRVVADRGEGRLRAPAPGPEAQREHVRRHGDRHQRRGPGAPAEGRLALRELGHVARDPALEPQERGRRRDAHARVDLPAAGGRGRAPGALGHPERPDHGRRLRRLEGGEHRPAPQDRGVERVRHGDLHAAVEDARRVAVGRAVHAQRQGGLRGRHRSRRSPEEAV
ncbi:MAG: ABC transporter, substrate-binding protein (cluster 1, maltose/g3p/polyamine/iron), partial [uncultured Solirubrobacteraceae bacterium]